MTNGTEVLSFKVFNHTITDDLLTILQIELEQLRTKVEKLEKERTTLKINCDKLESKVSLLKQNVESKDTHIHST